MKNVLWKLLFATLIFSFLYSCQKESIITSPEQVNEHSATHTSDLSSGSRSTTPSNFLRPIEMKLFTTKDACFPLSTGCSTWLKSSSGGNTTGLGKLIWTKSGTTILFTRPISGFSQSTDLADALGTIGNAGICKKTKQAHHIIPWEIRETNMMVQLAAKAGFHLNDYPNGIYLNKFSKCKNGVASNPFHSGSHPNYTRYIGRVLEHYRTSTATVDLTPSRTYNFLYCAMLPYLHEKLRTAETNAVNATNPGSLDSQYSNWTSLSVAIPGWAYK